MITLSSQTGRRSLGFALAAVAASLLLLSTATTSGHDASRPSTGAHKNDQDATRGKSQGPVSTTQRGLPPADQQAKRYTGPTEHAKAPQEHQEVKEGESQSPTSTKLLGYRGGATQTSPRIYLVLWGQSWTGNGDPYGVANRLHYFYSGLGGTPFLNVLAQYGGSTGTFTNSTGQYRGWLRNTTTVPAQPTDGQVAAVAQAAAVQVNDFGYNAQFVVATPWGVVDQKSTANSFCGWHHFLYAGPSGNWVTFTSLPYIPYLDYLGRGCGAGKVNSGSSGTLDGVTILAAHEYEESVNDPGLNAWWDADGDENADKCSWKNLANLRLTNGYTFPVQPAWSNTYRNQYGNGCLYSS